MKRTASFIPAVVISIISFILLTLPGKDLPENEFFEMVYFDKWVHIGMFASLAFFWGFPFIKYQEAIKLFLKAALFVIAYGIAMEFVQKYFTEGRSFDVTDMIADSVGAFLGYFILTRLRKRRIKNKPL